MKFLRNRCLTSRHALASLPSLPFVPSVALRAVRMASAAPRPAKLDASTRTRHAKPPDPPKKSMEASIRTKSVMPKNGEMSLRKKSTERISTASSDEKSVAMSKRGKPSNNSKDNDMKKMLLNMKKKMTVEKATPVPPEVEGPFVSMRTVRVGHQANGYSNRFQNELLGVLGAIKGVVQQNEAHLKLSKAGAKLIPSPENKDEYEMLYAVIYGNTKLYSNYEVAPGNYSIPSISRTSRRSADASTIWEKRIEDTK